MGSPLKNPLPREGHVVYKLKRGDVSYVGKHECKPNDRYVASGILVCFLWCARGAPTSRVILHHLADEDAIRGL